MIVHMGNSLWKASFGPLSIFVTFKLYKDAYLHIFFLFSTNLTEKFTHTKYQKINNCDFKLTSQYIKIPIIFFII
jgi:hypothetical protein